MIKWTICLCAAVWVVTVNGVFAEPDAEIPELSTVLSLFSANAGADGIRVNWLLDRQSPTITGFRVYRGYANAGHFAILAEMAPHAANTDVTYAYTDTSAIPGVTYYYKLASLGQQQESVFPVVISAAVKTPSTSPEVDADAPVVLLPGNLLELYVRESGLVQLSVIEPESRPLVNDTLAAGVYELQTPEPPSLRVRLKHSNGYSADFDWPMK